MRKISARDLALMVCDWCTERYKICEFILNDKTMSKTRKDKAAGAIDLILDLDEKMRAFLGAEKDDDKST